MKEYVSHFSAAYQLDVPCLNDVLGVEITNKYRDGRIVDVTVNDPTMVYMKKGYVVRSCKVPLPRGAVKKMGGRLIASPELVFLELANELDLHRLILLGLQMCSHPTGKPSGAVTTKNKLEIFLKYTCGHHGHKKAEAALKYIEDGSASLMESILFMVLTLSHSLGGYGLSGACFNREITLFSKGKRQLDQKRCVVDIYYSKAYLAIEYDSFKYHNTPSAQSKDQLRAYALKQQGIEVMHLTTKQFYDEKLFMEFIVNLAARLGKRIRIRTKKFYHMHEKIRKLLP